MQKKQLIEHAINQSPYESCAVLLGQVESNGTVNTKKVILTENSDKSSSHFSIPNDDLIMIYDDAAKKGLDVVAIFHSHPFSEAFPSETDASFMLLNPVPWIIFSNTKGELAAFMLETKQSETLGNMQRIGIEYCDL